MTDVPCKPEKSLLISEKIGRQGCVRVREVDWGWGWSCVHRRSGIFPTRFLVVILRGLVSEPGW